MKRVVLQALVTGLMIAGAAIGIVVAGGGGGATLSLSEYLTRVDTLDDDANVRFNDLQAQLGPNPDLAKLQEYYPGGVDIIGDFVSGLKELKPPGEAKAAHEEALAAVEQIRDEFAVAVEAGRDAQTVSEYNAGTRTEAFTVANNRFAQACAGLQTVADENSIDVTMDCAG